MKKIITSFIFALICVLGIGFAATTSVHAAVTPSVEDADFSSDTIAFLGDSITYGTGTTAAADRFSDIVSTDLGFLSFQNLGDVGSTISVRTGETDSFYERYTDITAGTDYIVIFGGVNDYLESVEIGDVSSTDTSEFYGALNELFDDVQTTYPAASILVVTPMKSYDDGPSTELNLIGYNLQNYVDAITASALSFDIPVIDLHEVLGFNALESYDRAKYTDDGVNLNDLGHERIANILMTVIYDEFTPDLVDEVTTGYYVDDSGSLVANAGYSVTDFIEVEPGTTYVSYGDFSTFYHLSYFDANGNFVTRARTNQSPALITIPAGVEKIRITYPVADTAYIRELYNYKTFTVTFDTNTTTSVDAVIVKEGEAVELPNEDLLIKTGYSFTGWALDEELEDDFSVTSAIYSDITLYGVWSSSNASVTPVVVTAPAAETAELLGIAWYWYLGIAAAAYVLLSKKGRKIIGLKK
ncbi:MAG: InlB B-repeat-containing protein [Tenericutes bacterium]|nr:InlB B-repeat-containing protein [Mycoplasmatota bacterium]